MGHLRDEIFEHFYWWMFDLVSGEKKYSKELSFNKLLRRLNDTEFVYSIRRDENRAEDGISLRYRYLKSVGHPEDFELVEDEPCSILEMMVALAIRMEESIMDDPEIGDRTGQWFWGMVVNLGLGSMTDGRYDEEYVDYVLDRFLDRDYEPDGRGGLFRVKHTDEDLRFVEIWYQMNWYLDELLGL